MLALLNLIFQLVFIFMFFCDSSMKFTDVFPKYLFATKINMTQHKYSITVII